MLMFPGLGYSMDSTEVLRTEVLRIDVEEFLDTRKTKLKDRVVENIVEGVEGNNVSNWNEKALISSNSVCKATDDLEL